jgi:Zn-dependent peptidase ImmA (M78 family)/fido (protein-threonine AMPylation protein)
MSKELDFSRHFHSAEVLATQVLKEYFGTEAPTFPLDPFKMLEKFNAVYQFRDFKDLEGVYLVPKSVDDIAIVGININRPITRQRFTAAHELCHHIKDRTNNNICPISGKKNAVELFADSFASELLMPTNELISVVSQFEKNGYVSFDDALYIANYFGVSFTACVFKIAYKLNKIDGDTKSDSLLRRIRKFKPDKKRQSLGLKALDLDLLKNVINSYTYFFENECAAVWYKFKNDFVYNENRLEGVNIDKEDIGEILADLRIKRQNSEYCKSEFQNIIEVVGHSSVYDYVRETNDPISAFKMLNLHSKLFQYAPFPEEAGKTRTNNNLVLGAKFDTVDHSEIAICMLEIERMIKELTATKNDLSVSCYVDEVIKIHHKITVVHPFSDGNGRVSRAMLNWQFKLKGLPPIYLKHEDKETYFNALRKADLEKEYTALSEVFYRELLSSMIQLNSKFLS